MSKQKFYLVNNWEAGIKHGTTFTGNGLETETYDKEYRITDAPGTGDDSLPFSITSTNSNVTIKESGYKIQLINATGSPQTTIIRGFYDNLDVQQIYRVVVNATDSIADTSEAAATPRTVADKVVTPPSALAANLRYEAYGLQGFFDFSTTEAQIPLTIPAGTTWYLYATDGGYLSIDRFKKQRRPIVELDPTPAERVSYYITELFRYNKLEDITKFFLPLVDAIDLKNPDNTVGLQAYVASSNNADFNFGQPSVTWSPIQLAPSVVTRTNPYFRFKIVLPTNKVVAATKIGYAISTEYGYSEPSAQYLSVSDVEQTVYRPKLQVYIGKREVTPWVDTVAPDSITLNIRKIDETRHPLFMENLTVFLDNAIVMTGRITGLSKQEYPNAVTYNLRVSSYRDLLGSSYQDNVFAFNASGVDVTTVPFANEFEYINYIVNYSPASNGVIINSDRYNNLRSMQLWTDQYDTINRTGGMGFGENPDKWIHFYTSSQKLTLEQIDSVANANRLAAEVTHTGNVILSDLIPHDECTLQFNSAQHDLDQTSLLSKCTHRYHDYVSKDSNNQITHTYIPDHRLYVPEVNYDLMQAASIVRVNGTTGKNQVATTAMEQYVGTIKGFDTGQVEYVRAGQELNYRTQLTTREPSDTFRIAFFADNKITNNNEQTLLKGSPRVEGWESVTYETDKGGLFQPSIQPSPAGLKIEQKWINGTLDYEDGEFDDMYGIKFLEVTISTDDLRDEPVRQGFLGAALGFALAFVIVAATVIATGGAAIPLLGGALTVGAGTVFAGGTAIGFILGVGNGTFVSRVNVQLPLKVKGVPAISAHQDYTEAPLIGLPDGKWFPRWANTAYQEMLLAKDGLGVEAKVVDNPYVVSLTNYKQPLSSDFTNVADYKSAVKYNVYNKEMHNIVASGLTLREWLRSRAVTLRYAGNPNWYPFQFIAIAKPPTTGTAITEYEYFYTLGPQSTSISVGGEVTAEIEAAYVGSSSGSTEVRNMEVLNNSLTLD